MFLSKRKASGVWYIFYNRHDGKRSRISTGTTHKNEALRFLHQFEAKKQKEFLQDVIPMTVKNFFWEYLKRCEAVDTYKTVKIKQGTFKFFTKYIGEQTLLENIKLAQVETYLFGRIKETSIYAARKDLINLSSAFNKAISNGYLLKNPCKGIKRFKLPEVQPLFFSKEDFTKLIEIMDVDCIKDLAIFGVNTGCREMEMLSLQWEQVNFTDRLIILSNQSHITKSKKVRSIPLNNSAFDVLKRRYERKDCQYVFSDQGEPLKANHVTWKFKRYIKKLPVNQKLKFHSLRHTFASWLIQANVPIYSVSKLLGHADIKTTEIYSHLRKNDLQNCVNVLNEY